MYTNSQELPNMWEKYKQLGLIPLRFEYLTNSIS